MWLLDLLGRYSPYNKTSVEQLPEPTKKSRRKLTWEQRRRNKNHQMARRWRRYERVWRYYNGD